MNTENNKLIMEFMNLKPRSINSKLFGWSHSPFYNTVENSYEKVIDNMASYVKYATSWDWLMPVVEKIEYMLHDDLVITIQYKTCNIPVVAGTFVTENDGFDIECNGNSKIEAVYNAVIEFIKWYNSQNINK